MSHRTPFAVAVVGALLVGGATTGTTLARWQDVAPISPGTLQAGDLKISVNRPGTTSVDLGRVDLVVGQAATVVTAHVANKSQPGAANLRYDLRYIGGATTASLDSNHLQIAVTAKGPGDCVVAADGYTPIGTASSVLNETPIRYEDFAICISVKAVAGGGSEGHVSLNFEAVQRP